MLFTRLRRLHQLLEAADRQAVPAAGATRTPRFAKRCQFPFAYHGVPFAVCYLGDLAERELLLGHRGEPFVIRLAVDASWSVRTYLNDGDYARARAAVAANLANDSRRRSAGLPTVTGADFVRALHDAVPSELEGVRRARPQDVADAVAVTEPEKRFFSHWQSHPCGPSRENLEKTRLLIGADVAALCRTARISSCWTADADKAREVSLPRHRPARVVA